MFEIISVVLFLLLAISVYFNVKFGIVILNTADTIEESLDALDEKYKIFATILERPVFFDSIEIRQVIQEIKSSQDLLLLIANKLSNYGRVQNEENRK